MALLLVASVSWVCFQMPAAQGYLNITSEEAYEMLVSDPTVFLLDVRTASEYESGHIGGAILIVNHELASRIHELPANMSLPILVYCLSGGRSAASAEVVEGWGYSDVFNMADGISGWRTSGYPVVTGPEPGVFRAEEGVPLLSGTAALLVCLAEYPGRTRLNNERRERDGRC